jgi:hypothetical protein
VPRPKTQASAVSASASQAARSGPSRPTWRGTSPRRRPAERSRASPDRVRRRGPGEVRGADEDSCRDRFRVPADEQRKRMKPHARSRQRRQRWMLPGHLSRLMIGGSSRRLEAWSAAHTCSSSPSASTSASGRAHGVSSSRPATRCRSSKRSWSATTATSSSRRSARPPGEPTHPTLAGDRRETGSARGRR